MSGLVYHVICRGIERSQIFKDVSDYEQILKRLSMLAGGENIAVYAYVLMPNHFHLLVRPLKVSLAIFMRRLLTSYAIYFNRRHKRSGHLFQNRYKSFVVEEDHYFLELIRYIHLNPLRAGIVDSPNDLYAWPYCGHAALMGKDNISFLEADEVLSHFAKNRAVARRMLNEFMRDGIAMGRRADLVGGGLRRSIAAGLLSSDGEKWAYNEQILGSGEFVAGVLAELQEQKQHSSAQQHEFSLEHIFQSVAAHYGISVNELYSGARRDIIVRARTSAIWLANKHLIVQASSLAKVLNVSASTICSILKSGRGEDEARAISL